MHLISMLRQNATVGGNERCRYTCRLRDHRREKHMERQIEKLAIASLKWIPIRLQNLSEKHIFFAMLKNNYRLSVLTDQMSS